MTKSGAAALTEWLSTYDPRLQTNEKLFKKFLKDKHIDPPDEAWVDIVHWVMMNHFDDFSIWLDNQWDLDERFEMERNNDNFESGAQELGSKTWFIHFTDARFTQFNDGVTREFLGQSGKSKDYREVKCPDNLSLPPEQQKWIHAYTVFDEYGHSGDLDDAMLHSGRGYGHNALLFQSDEGVLVKHLGHEQFFAVVLACSEYNAVYLTGLERNDVYEEGRNYDRRTLRGTAHLKSGEVYFDDIQTLVERLEAPSASLGGFGRITRRPGRWHRWARAKS